MVIKVKPQAKKAKVDATDSEETPSVAKTGNGSDEKEPEGTTKVDRGSEEIGSIDVSRSVPNSGLVSYSDESEDDDDWYQSEMQCFDFFCLFEFDDILNSQQVQRF